MTPSDPRAKLAELRANPIRQEDFQGYGVYHIFCCGLVRYQVDMEEPSHGIPSPADSTAADSASTIEIEAGSLQGLRLTAVEGRMPV